ncbi:nef attachable domain protein, partial [Chlamydia psittaci 08DC60]
QRVTTFPSRSLQLWRLLCNLQNDIWKPIEVYCENGNILR